MDTLIRKSEKKAQMNKRNAVESRVRLDWVFMEMMAVEYVLSNFMIRGLEACDSQEANCLYLCIRPNLSKLLCPDATILAWLHCILWGSLMGGMSQGDIYPFAIGKSPASVMGQLGHAPGNWCTSKTITGTSPH